MSDNEQEQPSVAYKKYKSIVLPLKLHRRICQLKVDGSVLDFTVQVDDTKFPCHRVLLAAFSEYFSAMFRHDTMERRNSTAQLHNLTSRVFQAILDYIYTSELVLNVENVQEVLVAAYVLQLEDVPEYCDDFLRAQIAESNCLDILALADRYKRRDLYQRAFKYCLYNFEILVARREFQDLEDFLLERLISSEYLQVEAEETVLEAVRGWLDVDRANRSDTAERLMAHVRFPRFNLDTLLMLRDDGFIQNSSVCRKLVDEAINYIRLQDCMHEHPKQKKFTFDGPRFKARKSWLKQCIYAVGGWSIGGPIATVEKFDPQKEEEWTEVISMTKPRGGAGAAFLGEILYAIGGYDGQGYTKTVEGYHIVNKSWNSMVPDMMTECADVGVVALDGYIYAVGGQNTSGALGTVQRFSPTDGWKFRASLQVPRFGAGVTVLDGCIWVVGGQSGAEAVHSVEVYDPAADSWRYSKPLNSSRKLSGCCTYDGRIYVVGGYHDDYGALATAECYDPKLDEWITIRNMSKRRSGLGLVELDGILYAVGGQDGRGNRLKLVEAYDPKTGQWTEKTPMIYERLGCGLAVYSGPEYFDKLVCSADMK